MVAARRGPARAAVLHGLPADCCGGLAPAELLRFPYARHRIHDRALARLDVGRRWDYPRLSTARLEALYGQGRDGMA